MSIKSHHITRRESYDVARALRRAGYSVTGGQCYAYAANLASFLEPMDFGAQARVLRFIAAALADATSDVYHAEVELLLAQEQQDEENARQARLAAEPIDWEAIGASQYVC